MHFQTSNDMYMFGFGEGTNTNIWTYPPRNKTMRIVIYIMRFNNKHNYGMLKDGVMIKNADANESKLYSASNIKVNIGRSTDQANISDVEIFGEKIYIVVWLCVVACMRAYVYAYVFDHEFVLLYTCMRACMYACMRECVYV